MRLIDKGQEIFYVVEARRKAFEEFVKAKSKDGYRGTGWTDAALFNEGFSDYFAPVTFRGGLHDGLFVMTDGGSNANVLIFPAEKDAQAYGNSLQEVLKKNGFPRSKVYVQQIAVYSASAPRYFPSAAKTEKFDADNRFILRIRVRK